jgi:SAM-dependent methyltransferase
MDNDERGACLQRITDGALRPGGLALTDRALEFCRIPREARVLDAGCGRGVTLKHLRERHGARCCGVDLSMEMLEGARCEDRGVPLVRARMEEMPFGDGAFQGVLCECALSHANAEAAVREFSRVVEGGGFLVLSDLYCLSGAAAAPQGMDILGRDRLEEYLARSSFDIVTWEDRTADLKRLAAELIMSGCSLPPYYTAPGSCRKETSHNWRGIGYYLLVARRTNGNQLG